VIVLGLDPSLTNFGWAIHDTEAEGAARCLARGRFQTTKKGFVDEVSRYVFLRKSLEELLEAHPEVEVMGIEHPVMNEDYSEGMYALFIQSLIAIKGQSKDLVLVGPPQIKKFARDKSGLPSDWKMGKQDMSDTARDDTGGGRWDHNEADAYHVACFAGRWWKYYVGDLEDDELTPYELKTFTHIRRITKGKRAGQLEIKGFLHREGDRFFLWSMTSRDPHVAKKTHRKTRRKKEDLQKSSSQKGDG